MNHGVRRMCCDEATFPHLFGMTKTNRAMKINIRSLTLDIEVVRPLRSLDDRELALVVGGGTTRPPKVSSFCTI